MAFGAGIHRAIRAIQLPANRGTASGTKTSLAFRARAALACRKAGRGTLAAFGTEESGGATRRVVQLAWPAAPSLLALQSSFTAQVMGEREHLAILSLFPMTDERAPADQGLSVLRLDGNAGELLRTVLVLHAHAVRTFSTQLTLDEQAPEWWVAVRHRVAIPCIGRQGSSCIEREHRDESRFGLRPWRPRRMRGHQDQSHQWNREDDAEQGEQERARFQGTRQSSSSKNVSGSAKGHP